MGAVDFLKISGNPYERGASHGRARSACIRAHLNSWRAALGEAGIGEPESYVSEFLRKTDFLPAIREHVPHLLLEVEGIAAGAEADFDQVLALQFMDEEWAFRARRFATDREKCSSAAFAGADGSTLIGQNMDLPGYTEGHQLLLQIDGFEDTPAALVFSTAGMIGLMGVNAAGIGVCVNSLPQLPCADTGVPVAFVLRKLLETRSLAEAAALVCVLPHATNQHYLIAEPGAVRSFEASAAGVTEYMPPNRSRVLHTNHPLATSCREENTYRENSEARLGSLLNRLTLREVALEDLKAALSAFDHPLHPVCRLHDAASGLKSFTTGSMVSRLSPRSETIESWVSAGPPSRGYEKFLLNKTPERSR